MLMAMLDVTRRSSATMVILAKRTARCVPIILRYWPTVLEVCVAKVRHFYLVSYTGV